MKDYETIDLSGCCNVGNTFFDNPETPRLGAQTFHGLPFLIGQDPPDARRCLIGCCGGDGTASPVTIPIGKAARYVIFAHTLLETKMEEGEPIGREVAAYVVKLVDGEAHRLTIRERFEVAPVPTLWGQQAFLALPDLMDELMPRYEGQWDAAGRRQSETTGANPMAYYVWAWQNEGGGEIESITLEPADRKFVLAAITLGHLEEHPLRKVAKREVVISLNKDGDASEPFDMAVEVDRGVATFPFSLPKEGADTFVKDGRKGWGEPENKQSSPAYVEIAARRSATVTVKNKGEQLAQINWGKLQEDGKADTPRVNFEMADNGRNWVHVKVIDDETGKPVPCRVHFRSPKGIPYQPHGHHNQVNRNLNSWHQDIGGDLKMGQISYAYIDGTCQGWLPRGEVIVDVARGFEYEPVRQKLTIKPGQRALELRLKRWTNMNAAGWYSGDSHVHFLGDRGAHREAQGEDLNVVNLLASQWGHLFTNTEDFIGRPSVSDDGATIVYCSQENRQHLLGHLILWGLKVQVSPWCSDGPGEAELGGNMEITMSRWADQCRAQGGTVVIPHLPAPNGEPATLIATGRADAVEMLIQGGYQHQEYYRYLNCGYKLPLVGGTDKMSSDVPVGIYRTYAHVGNDQPFNYDNWCQAVKAGRTFLSGGPIIDIKVNGVGVGETIKLPGNGGTVEVEATAESIIPIYSLQIVQEGNVIASTEVKKGARRLELKEKVKIESHSWLAARCGGPKYEPMPHYDAWGRGIFAHTSPVYLAVGGDWWMFDEETAQYMLTLIDGSVEYIRHTAAHHEHDNVTHHHTHHDHQQFLEEPFHEAAAAIHRRMHQLGIKH